MTTALCFQCGKTKFGALVPCGTCGAPASGNMSLDIAFSDHYLSIPALEAFGEVVRAIRIVCDDERLRLTSFLRYVSTHHNDILGVVLPPDLAAECDAVLDRADPPRVAAEPSERGRQLREPSDRNEPGAEPDDQGV